MLHTHGCVKQVARRIGRGSGLKPLARSTASMVTREPLGPALAALPTVYGWPRTSIG